MCIATVVKNRWDLMDKDRMCCWDLTSTGKLDVKREERDAIPLRTRAAGQWSVHHQSAAAHVVAGRCVVKMAVRPLGETSHKRLCCGESEMMTDLHTLLVNIVIFLLRKGLILDFCFLLEEHIERKAGPPVQELETCLLRPYSSF